MPDISGKLFPNVTTIIVQLLATGVLFFVFKKFFWKHILTYFAARADFIESTIKDAKEMNETAKENMNIADEKAREAAVQYRAILDSAKEDAKKAKQDIIDEANREAQHKIEQARKEIATEQKQAQTKMKEEIVEVAIDVASKVMDQNMSSKKNNELVEGFVDEVVN